MEKKTEFMLTSVGISPIVCILHFQFKQIQREFHCFQLHASKAWSPLPFSYNSLLPKVWVFKNSNTVSFEQILGKQHVKKNTRNIAYLEHKNTTGNSINFKNYIPLNLINMHEKST